MGITETRTCGHREGWSVVYVRNDGKGAPVILVETDQGRMVVISLTNQVIRLSCPSCFEEIRRAVLVGSKVDIGLRRQS